MTRDELIEELKKLPYDCEVIVEAEIHTILGGKITLNLKIEGLSAYPRAMIHALFTHDE